MRLNFSTKLMARKTLHWAATSCRLFDLTPQKYKLFAE
jgi:hypothetical protein